MNLGMVWLHERAISLAGGFPGILGRMRPLSWVRPSRFGRRTNESLYGSAESFLDRVETGAVTLDELRARSGPYPKELLPGCETALVLFGAAFLGANDAIHLADAGIAAVTVVDIDGDRLERMRALYPPTWRFVAADAFAFSATEREAGARYDLLSIDPFTGLMPRCREHLPVFLELARRALVLGVEHGGVFEPPAGWRASRVERSDLADWLVLEPV
jgi:hypothetical protein